MDLVRISDGPPEGLVQSQVTNPPMTFRAKGGDGPHAGGAGTMLQLHDSFICDTLTFHSLTMLFTDQIYLSWFRNYLKSTSVRIYLPKI